MWVHDEEIYATNFPGATIVILMMEHFKLDQALSLSLHSTLHLWT
jgi:hypothetical protein